MRSILSIKWRVRRNEERERVRERKDIPIFG